MSKNPSLARRVAPAMLLGSAAIAVVALFDPVFGHGSGDAGGNLFAAPATSDSGANPGINSGSNTSTKTNTKSKSASADCANGTAITGSVIDTRYGPVQLQATVSNGAICAVTPLAEPSGDGRTNYISQQVFPYLDKQAVKVGIDFQAVSGATYTSEGYRSALQSILDQM
ncbi:unannotated protein [freshwater metagenome]|uniref:Unannotated protein n=1 Tax=freshwater metagenome TaxID=449393 RepID=A0A6J7IEM1_9ZZZZ